MPFSVLQVVMVVALGAAVYTWIAQSHMALHRTGHRPLGNRVLVSTCMLMLGLSSTRWIEQHNRRHHPYLNRDGFDPDLDFEPIFRLHTSQPWRPWHRYQAYYCWLLYPLTLFGMSLGSFRIVLLGTTRDGRTFERSQRRKVLSQFAFGPPLILAACIACLGVTRGVVDWIAVYMVTGTLLGVTFQINHCSVLPGEDLDRRWQAGLSRHDRILLGTLDLRPSSSALAAFTGSLSRHSAHHMNPTRDQAWIAATTKALQRSDPSYRQVPTIWAGLRAHARYMQSLGHAPSGAVEDVVGGDGVDADGRPSLTDLVPAALA